MSRGKWVSLGLFLMGKKISCSLALDFVIAKTVGRADGMFKRIVPTNPTIHCLKIPQVKETVQRSGSCFACSSIPGITWSPKHCQLQPWRPPPPLLLRGGPTSSRFSVPHIVLLAGSPHSAQPSEHCLGEPPLKYKSQSCSQKSAFFKQKGPHLSGAQDYSPHTPSFRCPPHTHTQGWCYHPLRKRGSNRRKQIAFL